MNLNAIVSQAVGAVNPLSPISVQVSTGSQRNADTSRTPQFASLAQFTGSIAGRVLTVSSVASGALAVGQAVIGIGVSPATLITHQIDGTPGGVGDYQLTTTPNLASSSLQCVAGAMGQIQNLTYRDLQQLEGLNIQGVRHAVYINGRVDGIIRSQNKGGDLITFSDGTTWLIAHVLEYWPTWCKVAATLQNGS